MFFLRQASLFKTAMSVGEQNDIIIFIKNWHPSLSLKRRLIEQCMPDANGEYSVETLLDGNHVLAGSLQYFCLNLLHCLQHSMYGCPNS